MEALDVTCPDCGSTRGVECRISTWGSIKRKTYHDARYELAADWRALAKMGEELVDDESPDLDDVEHLARFGDDDERFLARRLLALADRLGYSEPGDEENA